MTLIKQQRRLDIPSPLFWSPYERQENTYWRGLFSVSDKVIWNPSLVKGATPISGERLHSHISWYQQIALSGRRGGGGLRDPGLQLKDKTSFPYWPGCLFLLFPPHLALKMLGEDNERWRLLHASQVDVPGCINSRDWRVLEILPWLRKSRMECLINQKNKQGRGKAELLLQKQIEKGGKPSEHLTGCGLSAAGGKSAQSRWNWRGSVSFLLRRSCALSLSFSLPARRASLTPRLWFSVCLLDGALSLKTSRCRTETSLFASPRPFSHYRYRNQIFAFFLSGGKKNPASQTRPKSANKIIWRIIQSL